MTSNQCTTPWALSFVETAADRAITKLVAGFCEHPYKHRVEHSLHLELYNLLLQDSHLNGMWPIGHGRYKTQLVHKEWPTQVAASLKEGGRKRKQSFDIGVVAPADLEKANIEDFSERRIPATVAIELGLDYSLYHLQGDITKLKLNPDVPLRYIVHFSRKRTRLSEQVDERIRTIPKGLKAVFVGFDPGSGAMRIKDLHVPEIRKAKYGTRQLTRLPIGQDLITT